MPSNVNHPKHYNLGDIETIEYLESLGIAEDFCIGNVIKYVSRYKHKKGKEDLEKARWYLDRVISYYDSPANMDHIYDALSYYFTDSESYKFSSLQDGGNSEPGNEPSR